MSSNSQTWNSQFFAVENKPHFSITSTPVVEAWCGGTEVCVPDPTVGHNLHQFHLLGPRGLPDSLPQILELPGIRCLSPSVSISI